MAESCLSDLGDAWAEMVDRATDWQVELLRRVAVTMGEALDRQAMLDVEGSKDWRDLAIREERYASARS